MLARSFCPRCCLPELCRRWENLPAYHKGYDHLHTVITFITAVTKSAFILWVKVCITLKISARQIIEQHLEPSAEQIFPALLQMAKKLRLVGQQQLMHPIKLMAFLE